MELSIDREKVIKELESLRDICNAKSDMAIGKGKIAWAGYANAARDAIALLKGQPEIVCCIDCKWYDERISMCDNCGLPREQTFFCADGKRRDKDD